MHLKGGLLWNFLFNLSWYTSKSPPPPECHADISSSEPPLRQPCALTTYGMWLLSFFLLLFITPLLYGHKHIPFFHAWFLKYYKLPPPPLLTKYCKDSFTLRSPTIYLYPRQIRVSKWRPRVCQLFLWRRVQKTGSALPAGGFSSALLAGQTNA